MLCALWLVGSGLAANPTKPNIVLITLDTTRADRMGFLGSTRGLTPNLDQLALDSTVFTRAYSQAPLTPPSHATILTGTYPQFHQVTNFGVPLGADVPYAPAILKAQGYHTAAFVAALVLDAKAGAAPGFDRGFDTYDAGFSLANHAAGRYHSVERRGEEVVTRALTWLTKHPKGPFFIWVHLYDAHDPYEPPEPYRTKYAANPYDGEIAYEDAAIGRFLTELRERGLYRNTIIAAMADHGEALGDHGEDTHGFFLYDETIHVPLLIKLPGGASPETRSTATRIENRVRLVDVMPTILQAAGIAVPKEVQGESLVDVMKASEAVPGTPLQDRQAYSESDYGQTAYGWSRIYAMRTSKYLYVDAPRPELYDQSSDPQANRDLASTSKAIASTIAGQLDRFRKDTGSSREAAKSSMDPGMQEKLAALGYVAGGKSVSKNASTERGADPKDKIEIGNLIHRANILRDDEKCDEAVPVLRKVIEKEPDVPVGYQKLAQCLIATKNYSEALPVLRKLVQLNGDTPQTHYSMAEILVATEDFAGGAKELQVVVARAPRWKQAGIMLATCYLRTDRVPDAIKEYNRLLELSPDDFESNLLLGRALLVSGDPDAAIPKLKKAATVQPDEPDPHKALSNAYARQGRMQEAVEERAEFDRLTTARSH